MGMSVADSPYMPMLLPGMTEESQYEDLVQDFLESAEDALPQKLAEARLQSEPDQPTGFELLNMLSPRGHMGMLSPRGK